VAIIILAIVTIYGLFTGKDLISNFLFALALAAAVVPEGLPATVSVALSIAASRLAKKKALIKKLTSTESLGAATVICTDKTGTITLGKMELQAYWSPKEGDKKINDLDIRDLAILKNIFILCNHAEYTDDKLTGNYNEVSLLEYLIKTRVNFEKIRKLHPIIHEIPFTSERKMMSVVVKIDETYWLLTKGLTEKVVEKCRLKTLERKKILEANKKFSTNALHDLSFAYKKLGTNFKIAKNPHNHELLKFDTELESDLTYLGLAGLSDPVKEGVIEAMKNCHQAGIRVVMITGDSPLTALAVGKKINIFNDKTDHIFTGDEINSMSDLELRHILQKNAIFAEVSPEHKLRIVENLQAMGEIVAVTGDGVNDAPALKKADIGVSMGHKGTDVAKEAADMILLDDNFATIVKAIYEGRTIFENIQKIVYYVFSSNAGELLAVVIGVILGMPLPIIAVQILAIDLGTDVLPSLALAFDRGDDDLMEKPATHKRASLLNTSNLPKLLVTGLVMGIGANVSYHLLLRFGYSYAVATTSAYATIVFCQVASVLMTHMNFKGAILSNRIFNNFYLILAEIFSALLLFAIVYLKPFQYLLSTAALNPIGWAVPVLSALLLAILGQIFFMKKVDSSIAKE
jgi:Ca2+-transporting ATPase